MIQSDKTFLKKHIKLRLRESWEEKDNYGIITLVVFIDWLNMFYLI